MLLQLSNFIATDIRTCLPILIAAFGLLYSEQAGVVNIGAEGMMLLGAFTGVVGYWVFGNAWVCLLCAMLTGGVTALIFGFFTIIARADQVVVGAGINILGLGVTSTLNRIVFGMNATPPKIDSFNNIILPQSITSLPVIGEPIGIIFGQSIFAYLMILIIIIGNYILFKTKIGLSIRAVGEYPKACDTVGVNVYRVRYATVIFSGLFCGAAGAYVSLGLLSFFMENMIAGKGFMALGAIIFGKYKPWRILVASLIFGAG